MIAILDPLSIAYNGGFSTHRPGADMAEPTVRFETRRDVEQVEEGNELAPRFDEQGLIPVVTTDYGTGELLMQGYMNAEALARTIETAEAHYFSRSRQVMWGNGASCHVGYRSCFYRRVPLGPDAGGGRLELEFTETEKVFDPEAVYGDAPNPTVL